MTNTLSFTKFKTLIFFCLFVVLCGFSFAQPLNEGLQIDNSNVPVYYRGGHK